MSMGPTPLSAMKNPTFGIYQQDDEKSDYGSDIADPRINVEHQALARVNNREDRYPVASIDFVLRMLPDMTTEVVVNEDGCVTVWRNPPGPCLDTSRWQMLCDGHVPSCEPYRGITANEQAMGYAPRGCKEYYKCIRSWRKKAIRRA
ncbi:hypothetical protein A6M21_07725 [Desulfotomaculum copahuensis]|uniref:Uncharacterized protein n=1 Tax=Desulfotomaculum copahuensis TaxID=1838280 RepID=A0A1B7LG98_9FIRM|nr:hypothetical protein A6M21_07725 [Desulfotomaculum copahuensis]